MRKNIKGFTLTEILIALAIVGMFMPMVYATLMYGLKSYNSGQEFLLQQTSVHKVKTKIRSDINRCNTIEMKMKADNKTLENIIFSYAEPVYGLDINGVQIDPGEELDNLNFSNRKWSFDEDKDALIFGASEIVVPYLKVDYSNILESSRFEYNGESDNAILTMYIVPEKSNESFYSNISIESPIAIEYSLRYKNLIHHP